MRPALRLCAACALLLAAALQTGFVASTAIDGDTLVIGGLDGTLYAFPVG
jgi:hypothetical protein